MGQTADKLSPYPYGPDHVDMDSDGEDENADIEEIKEDIEQTRAELSVTIDSIQERLAPQHLVEQAKDAAREAGGELVEEAKAALATAASSKADELWERVDEIMSEIGYTARDASGNMMDTVKANPLPAAVAAVGLGWLFMRRRTSSRPHYGQSAVNWDQGYPRETYTQRTQSGTGESKNPVGQIAGSAADMAEGAVDRAGHMATSASSTAMDAGSSFWGTVRRNPVPAALTGAGMAWLYMNRNEPRIRPMETMASTMEPVGEMAGKAKGQLADMTDSAVDQVVGAAEGAKDQITGLGGSAQSKVERLLQDSPLVVGAAAIGIGAAIGLAIPTAARERELMGDAREAFGDRTQQLANEAQEHLKHVADQVQESAKEEFQQTQKAS